MAFNEILSTGIILLYLIISVGVGLVAWRIQPSTSLEDYSLANRSIHWFTGFFSMLASQISALAMLGFAAFYFLQGMAAYLAIVTSIVVSVAGAFRFIGPKVWKIGRQTGQVTPSDTLREYFDSPTLGYVVAAGMILGLVPYLQLQFMGLGIVLDLGTGGLISQQVGVIVIATAIVIYTWLGGMKSVTWVDTMQGIMLFLGSFVAGLFLVLTLGGGFEPTFNNILEAQPAFLEPIAPEPPYNNWVTVLSFGLIAMLGLGLAPHMWIRLHYFEEGRSLERLPGVYSLVFWLTQVGVFSAVLAGVLLLPDAPPDQYIPLLYREYFPTPVFALIMSAILAAVMSSASSMCHAIGIIGSRDITKQIRPEWSEDSHLLAARVITLVAVVAAVILTFLGVDFILTSGAAAGALIVSITVPQLISAVYTAEWPTREGAVLAAIAGGTVSLAGTVGFFNDPMGFYPGTFGFVVNVVVFVGVSLVTSGTPDESRISDWRNLLEQSYTDLDAEYRNQTPTEVTADASDDD
ncbi:sodium:solute symporter family protein [Natrialbaceae archaeon AArc-T1-2]|uniref:sodium:solute symporter family protein n=1 Tax=Natrialbaceae archaeon AArc-T1-2 TaxID=3053904 RepID=UPI00255AECF2|nr:sodium:solute symporter family protein [Natrialbaceae archaeon AArc-T1-2]WIV68717.1 sodium:solute symporter family protein [Natrialbaceae archaeon AArc-T1-2]